MKKVISIDIGSTYTKGGLFLVRNSKVDVKKKTSCPTTQSDLYQSFSRVLGQLLEEDNFQLLEEDSSMLQSSWTSIPLYLSSSARGGLKIAAVGIVPDLTLKMAYLTALSAGGKIVKVISYKINQEDIRELENLKPDIVLFTGGTDGGDEHHNLHNAGQLGRMHLDVPIIYAGNRSITEQIQDILGHRRVYCVENVLPDLEEPNPEPARQKIREVFLEQIVTGKGLDRIIQSTGTTPFPTPLSLYEFTRKILETAGGWDNFGIIDLGGATTDFYSVCPDNTADPMVILKGIREPAVKRTVEGDLGIRVNACSVYDAASGFIDQEIESGTIHRRDLQNYVNKVASDTSYIPHQEKESMYDRILARACLRLAVCRHSGNLETVYTPQGVRYRQRGKDLRGLEKLVGTGGYLSAGPLFDPRDLFAHRTFDPEGRQILAPSNFRYFRDTNYLLGLLGNIALDFPDQAVKAALEQLTEIMGS
ncbi:MAG: glutamate mutase L [Spirochaetota bacterium]